MNSHQIKKIKKLSRHVGAIADYACIKHRLRREYDEADLLYERVLSLEPGTKKKREKKEREKKERKKEAKKQNLSGQKLTRAFAEQA